jgi:flagellar motor switch protein FliM
MDKVLNQQEIDAMVRVARGVEGEQATAKTPTVTVWDVRKVGQIGSEQMRTINALHEDFARDLSHSMGAYLRIAFQAALVSAEHMTYGEFLKGIPEAVYVASCKLAPVGAIALFQLDLALAFPLIDVLLGGEGVSTSAPREITEIEEQILETVMRIICRELQNTWQALSLEFEFEQRQPPDQIQNLLPSEEKILSLSFEITLADCRGTLNLAVPAVVSNALLRKISVPRARSKLRMSADSSPRLRNRVLGCPFPAELRITVAGVLLSELMYLSPGDLLVLRRRLEEPAALAIHDCEIFSAIVARRGTNRAAQLRERSPLPESERKQP